MGKHKEPTANMKTVLLDLLNVVYEYDNGKAGLPHDVIGIHHMTLKAMAKPDYGKLIILDVSYSPDSPTKVIWTVAITAYGLRVAKKMAKSKQVINDVPINANGKKPRSLRTINWQVNVNQKEGRQVYEDAKAMKSDPKQSFTRTMNLLMELHKELKVGQVGLLQKLYPEAYATMLLIARNEIEMEREGDLRGLIEELKHHMVNAPRLPIKAANFDFSADDDTMLLDVRKDENAGKIASENFLKSIMALNPQPAPVQAGIRKLDVGSVAFSVPSDDDIEIEW